MQSSSTGGRGAQPILVYRIGQLGDTVVSLPAIAELHRQNPGRPLVLVTDRHPERHHLVSSWDIIGALGLCEEVLPYDVSKSVARNVVSYLKLAIKIRSIAPHEVVNLADRKPHQAWRDRIFFQWLCGIKRYTARPCDETRTMDSALSTPEWLNLLKTVRPSTTTDAQFRIVIPESAHREARAEMAKISSASFRVAFSPGSKMPSKQWPLERYIETATRILKESPTAAIALIGGAEDRPLAERLRQVCGPRAVNLCGRLSILGSAAALSRCAVYIGNDTGAMHLAAAVGTKCIALFSARDVPGKWLPIGDGHHVLRKNVGCSGCMLEVCDKHNLCLSLISVDEVMSAWHAVAPPQVASCNPSL